MIMELKLAPKQNIIHSEKWNELEWLSYFQQRLSDMRSKKEPFDTLFTQYEQQETLVSTFDNQK
jgi:hypothetical protein